MRFLKLLVFSIVVYVLQSCMAHRAYVPSNSEPLLITKKKEVQFSTGIRPFRYLYGDLAYAISNHIAIRASAGGFLELADFSAAALYFNSFKKINYFVGGVYNYKYNGITRSHGDVFAVSWTQYIYSCIYNSVGIVFGVNLTPNKKTQHHLNLTTLYNKVSKYEYYFLKEDRYQAFDNETLKYKIPNFISFAPSYSVLFQGGNNKNWFKMQFSVTICQKTLEHNYFIGPGITFWGYTYPATPNTRWHPVSEVMNLSIGYIFCSKRD